jgi:hypothetical protein
MEHLPESRGQDGGWIAWVVGFLILAVIAAIAIPGLLATGCRGSGERMYSTSLKTISTAEADFRANDRDWNHVNDFWTADVKGLYTMTSAAEKGAKGDSADPAIKLIELSIASADADGTFEPAGGENLPLGSFAIPAPKAGYWFAALTLDLSSTDLTEPTYRVDTGGTPAMGSCHNTSKFGFITFPDPSSDGKYMFIVNENNTIYRAAVTAAIRRGKGSTPGLNALHPSYRNWPDDETLRTNWSKPD